jgi:UDP-glucuronate 4-epimerase
MSPERSPILVTGAAGFIGYHLCEKLLGAGEAVIGIDNLNDYYDPKLKEARLGLLRKHASFKFMKVDITDHDAVGRALALTGIKKVVHLAAQAGVRYSLTNPHIYIATNVAGMTNILEACRQARVEHLVFASSSSVYGGNEHIPFSVHDNVDHPIALYAATKKAGELLSHTYAHLYNLPVTCLRFFTVYGPWGRPDMSYFSFTRAILEGKPIELYNEGKMTRDFTYVGDIVECISLLLGKPPVPNPSFDRNNPDPASSWAPWRVYNIGNDKPITLLEYVETLEKVLGKKAEKVMKPLQPGDVPATHADVTELRRDFGFSPDTPLEKGLGLFADWFRSYYK